MIRYAAKTLFGFWLFLPIFGMYLVNIVQQGPLWRGDAVYVVRGLSLIMWIICLTATGISAVDSARLTKPGNRYLLSSNKRCAKTFWWQTMMTFVPVGLLHIVVVCAVLVIDKAIVRDTFALILAVVAQLSTIFWFVAFGSFTGRFSAPLIGAPIAVVVAFLLQNRLMGMLSGGDGFRVLGDTGASLSQVGLTWNLQHLAVQIVVLTVTGMLLVFIPRAKALFGILPRPIGLVAVLGVFLGMFLVTSLVPGTLMKTSGVQADHCFKGETEICLFEEHASFSADNVAFLDHAFELARENGYAALIPNRVVETSVRGKEEVEDLTSGTMLLEPISVDQDYDSSIVMANLSSPLHCDALYLNDLPLPDSFFGDWDSINLTWARLLEEERTPQNGGAVLTPAQVEDIMERWQQCVL